MPERRSLLPDLLPAFEVLAKGVRHVLCYVTEALGEKRKAFKEYESGDYLDATESLDPDRSCTASNRNGARPSPPNGHHDIEGEREHDANFEL